MAGPEVKAARNLLGTPVSYAYAVKAGPWIFLNGHEAFAFAKAAFPKWWQEPASFPAVRPTAQPPRERLHPAPHAPDPVRVRSYELLNEPPAECRRAAGRSTRSSSLRAGPAQNATAPPTPSR